MSKKDLTLDDGFEEVPLDQGFEEVPLDRSFADKLKDYIALKAQTTGNKAVEALADVGKGAEDTSLGLARGLAFGKGGLSALSGAVGAGAAALLPESLGGIPAGELSADKLKDEYSSSADATKKFLESSEERSPYLTTAGELGGAIVGGGALAKAGLGVSGAAEGAKTLGQLYQESGVVKGVLPEIAKRATLDAAAQAPIGAAYGVLNPHVNSATGEEEDRLKSGLEGAATAGVIGGGLSLASNVLVPAANAATRKIASYVEDSPQLRQMKTSYKMGKSGINVESEAAQLGGSADDALVTKDTRDAKSIVDKIISTRSELGKDVGSSLENATKGGVTVDIGNDIRSSLSGFEKAFETDQNLAYSPEAEKLYDTMFRLKDPATKQLRTDLNPIEVNSLRDDVLRYAEGIQSKDPNLARRGYDYARGLGNSLKETVPEYKLAAERFKRFNEMVPETILSGSAPIEMNQSFFGDSVKNPAKLLDKTKSLIEGVTKSGTGTQEAKETYVNLIKNLKQLEQEEAVKVAKGQITKEKSIPSIFGETSESFGQKIKELGDQSALRQDILKVDPHASIGAKNIASGIYGSGKGVALSGINKAGVLTKKLENTRRYLASASNEQLSSVGDVLYKVPGLENLATSLKEAIQSNNAAKKNAIVFSIMQNPTARDAINPINLDE